MTHKFIIELTDDVKGYEDGVDYLERIYGAEEITDNEIYNQALEDFQNSDYWNDYMAKVIADAKADAIDECIKTVTDYCGGLPNNNLINELEKLKEQNNEQNN